GAVAFLGVELHSKDISAGNRASKRRWILDARRRHIRVIRLRIVAVREIESRAVVDTPPQRMFARAAHEAPAHMGDLQPAAVRVAHPPGAATHAPTPRD